eukprot:s4410_g6.t1
MDRAHIPPDVMATDRHFFSSFEHEYVLGPVQFQTRCFDPIMQSVLEIPDCSKIPITFEGDQPVIWVLHLFSGRRRRGDCHFWFESMQHLLPGFEIRVLSVDTAIDPKLGNLDEGVVFSRLQRVIRKKFFASGLPCETFSAARHVVLEGGHHPRPLRSQSHPWLLDHRTCRELYQVMIGSRLLLHSLILETALVLSGAGSMMEHPTEHPEADRASVWRTECHKRWILRLPDAHEHHIKQWKFGSKGVKPTTLRSLNMGPVELVGKILYSHEDPLAVRPMRPLKGRAEDGTFKTAAAKKYPSLLCRALTHTTLISIKYRLEHFGRAVCSTMAPDDLAWVQSLYSAACHSNLSGPFLPDFQGRLLSLFSN